MSNKKSWVSLALFLAICFLVELGGGLLTQQSVTTWYKTLAKPSWNPPDWVFGPVWTVLYVLIAIAGWLLYESPPSKERSKALTVYGIQLALNLAWSGFFFAMQNPLLGLIDIVLLWIFILLTILWSRKVNVLASNLLVPYFLWVSYAVTLNLAIWAFNRGVVA